MQKFRLDWNYHSNNIEGNSLTYGETRALILFGITAQGKPLKDHFEITGHNEAINWILEIVKGETVLTETFIRQLHTLLLKESSYKEAKTPDGKPTRRKIEIGKYKTLPNHVVTVTGETFYFATPQETSAKMHELIEWFRKEKEKPDVNPTILAALFHYRFIRIHPFDDGNGRVARILMNFILMQFDYPPVIIKTEDKENYYAVLRLADAGELEPFIEYITENLIRSLEIMIRGAKGESIEEPEDLDKELALLEGKLKGFGKKVDLTRTPDLVLYIIDESIIFLIIDFIKTCKKFNKFYVKSQFAVYTNTYEKAWQMDGEFNVERAEEFREVLWEYINLPNFSYVKLSYEYSTFNRENVGNFNYSSNIYLDFGKTHYKIKSE
ncbi:MAG: Fic family protein, partial [Acidobacteria bacterium]|nr:Fic family protein [Acidobacteriota bacterium]